MVNDIVTGFLASLYASLGTGLGASGIFLIRTMTKETSDMFLSGASGIMMSAAFCSLLLPAIESASAMTHSALFAVPIVFFGLILGAGVMHLIHEYLPHEHFISEQNGTEKSTVKRIWLFIIAIILHNFPEGIVAGVGFARGDVGHGWAIALGIGLQNIPEGLAVAVALVTIQFSKKIAFFIAFLTGFVEPVGGLLGSVAVWYIQPLIPVFLGFAAGAMIFIIINEIIPETHRRESSRFNSFSFLLGIGIMLFLDSILS